MNIQQKKISIQEILNKTQPDTDYETVSQQIIQSFIIEVNKIYPCKEYMFFYYDQDFLKYILLSYSPDLNLSIQNLTRNLFEEGIINLIAETRKPKSIKNIYTNNPSYFFIIPFYYFSSNLGVLVFFLNKEPENYLSNQLFEHLISQYTQYIYYSLANYKIQKKKDNLQLIINSNKRINYNLDIESNLKFILKLSMEKISADYGAIIIMNSEGKLFFKILSEKFYDKIIKNKWKPSKDIFSFVIENKLSLLINDLNKDIRFKDTFNVIKPDFGSVIVNPFFSKYFNGCFALFRNTNHKIFDYNDYDIIQTIISNLSRTLENVYLYRKINDTYLQTTLSMASAIEAKDPYTKGHSQRVMRFSLLIGKKLHLSINDLKIIRLAAILHDIGKIGIPEKIILKKGPLNPEEQKIMKKHPIIGYSIVKDIDYLKKGLPFILYHHEKADGSGYPYGISGDKIPLFAKIASVADSFDAMVSDRPYRKGLAFSDALKELRKNTGTMFDPKIVDAFVKALS